MVGRGGDDRLFAVDGDGNDTLVGGKGIDHCYGEKGDKFKGCEIRATNHSPTYPRALVMALVRALNGSIRKAERMLCQDKARDINICIS